MKGIAVARVIDRSRKRVSLDDILTMCAGIESLSELEKGSGISAEQIKLLTTAAYETATQQNIEIEHGRINGLFQQLLHQSLPSRLKLLAKQLNPLISDDDVKLFLQVVHRLRNIASHGHDIPEITMPKVLPAVRALLGLCTLYDLTSCSIPIEANKHTNIAAMKCVKEAIDELKRLK